MTRDIKVLQLEMTTVCNAICAQCSREDINFFNKNALLPELTLDKFKEVVDVDFIKNLDKMFMCGNFGDPAAAQESLELFEYVRTVNPTITLGLNTNGSIKNTKWWAQLGKLLSNSHDYCVFSIDGLEDTNPLYRQRTNFNKIIENASAFIQNGGNAHWDMLVFKHNEHHVDACLDLAKELGFSHFRTKVSKRFNSKPVEGLIPPTGYNTPNVEYTSEIDCYALKSKSIYLDANGVFYPCCWYGQHAYKSTDNIDEIMSNNDICVKACGTHQGQTAFQNQWVNEKVLK